MVGLNQPLISGRQIACLSEDLGRYPPSFLSSPRRREFIFSDVREEALT